MPFFDVVLKQLKQEREKKPKGICIPIHNKINDPVRPVSGMPAFQVSGLYKVGPTEMVMGKVIHGTLCPGMATLIRNKEVKIKSLQADLKSVDSLVKGKKGTLELKGMNFTGVKAGDIISFKSEK